MNKKLVFSPTLYLGESINIRKLDKLKKNLINNPITTKVFLLTISTNPSEQLDIMESRYVTFSYYNEHPLRVIGLAGSNGEAVKMVEKIVQDCLDKRGDVDLKAFLLERDSVE